MRVLTSKCPYCGSPIEATMEKLNEPVDCPRCNRPFEIEIPTAQVEAVREVPDEVAQQSGKLVQETGERELVRTHPAMFRAHPLRFLGLLGLFLLGGWGVFYSLNSGTPWMLWVTGACAAAAAVLLAIWWIQVLATTLTVTDARTLLRHGIFSRRTSEVEHDDVRNIQMHQSFLERIFHVGTIHISSAAQSNVEIIAHDIPHPNSVMDVIRQNQN